MRDCAMLDLAIDSKLRACGIVEIKIGVIALGGRVRSRAIVVQQTTKRPVRFEPLDDARASLKARLERRGGVVTDGVFPSRVDHTKPISIPPRRVESGMAACERRERGNGHI